MRKEIEQGSINDASKNVSGFAFDGVANDSTMPEISSKETKGGQKADNGKDKRVIPITDNDRLEIQFPNVSTTEPSEKIIAVNKSGETVLRNGEKQALIKERYAQLQRSKERLAETISFGEYLGKVDENPNVAQLSHARVFHMLEDAGVEVDRDGKRHFKFFDEEIFGLDGPLGKIYDYFGGAADRTEIRKRILLLVGPPGGGKSTIATTLKRGLENYSRTDKGKAYAIKGCPQHEEPLHAIPKELRPEMKEIYGVHIEGDLCPQCKLDLEEKHHGDYDEFEVERLVLSEKDRKGIGTFLPSDPKSQDVSELIGSVDFSTVGEYGTESDPRAYKFDGELNIANRGIMEYIEMLKADEKFHYVLLTLTQEQNLKIPRYPLVYADEVIISHTNENEYNAFLANPKAEALKDRVYPVFVPYNLRVSDEKKIYEKLLSPKESALKIGKNPEKGEVHIAPLTLDVAANFAVLSRLEDTPDKTDAKKIDFMKKLKLYNGEEVDGFSQKDLAEIRAASPKEGMSGISPRYVVNSLSTAFSKEEAGKDGKAKERCITPVSAIRKLRDGLLESASISDKEKKRIKDDILPEVRKDMDEKAKKEVQKAFVAGHEDHARATLQNYLDNVDAFCTKTKMKDPITDEEIEPNEKDMRSIEEQIGVTDLQKKGFREEVLIRVSSVLRQGKEFDYKSHPKLREAIEQKLLADYNDIIKTTLTAKVRNPEQAGRMDKVVEALVNDRGYCDTCANELLQYVSQLYRK